MTDQLPPNLPHYQVTEELGALYVRSLQGQDGPRVLRTFEEVVAREDHEAQLAVKPLDESM